MYRVLFFGRVQGVGFRWTVQRVANRFGVNGYVKNLPDGSVEMVCDCDEETLHLLIDEIESETTGTLARIDDVVIQTIPPKEVKGFEIRF